MSLTNTMMQPLVSMYEKGKIDKWEILFSRYGAWGAFMNEGERSNSILSPKNRKALLYSWNNTVPIVALNGDTVNIGNTYSCTIDDQENTSVKITPTFTQYGWGWNMYPGQYKTGDQPMNYVQMEDDFTHKADEYLLALMTSVDTSSRNILETNKNTYWTTNIANYYPTTGDALQISQAQKTDAFNQLSAVMAEMDLYEAALIIASTSLKPLTNRLEAQGEGNAINERFQFLLGNFIFTGSNRITNGTNIQSTGYMVQPGAIACFNRNNPDANAGTMLGGGAVPLVEWSTMMLPRLGMIIGTFFKANCAASPSALNYLNQPALATAQYGFGFNTEIGWLTPYNSDPTAKVTPIVKFEISNT